MIHKESAESEGRLMTKRYALRDDRNRPIFTLIILASFVM